MQLVDLEGISGLRLERGARLSEYTRFGLGGPARLLVDAPDETGFLEAWRRLKASGVRMEVIGGGSNLVVADDGFDGVILRYVAAGLRAEASRVIAGAGAVWQDLVDYTLALGLEGIHTMTGVPGWVGGAVYGNAGAYGRSIHQNVTRVRFFDGERVREFGNAECDFRYRSSAFKDHKGWIVLEAELGLTPAADVAGMRARADEIRAIRDSKFPPTMKCAGSIFKNLLMAELAEDVRAQVDPKVVREGKVPSAWFLDQVGARGLRNGDILVADYHANLIYNAGEGTARQVREVIADLKARVRARFGFEVEEEVQYVGF